MPPTPKCSSHWTMAERLQRRGLRDPETGCFLWTGCRNTCGYGYMTIAGKKWLAHRAAWTVANGPIPKGLVVCHRCDVSLCINPEHLFLGTHQQNMADLADKFRRGVRHRRSGPANRLVTGGTEKGGPVRSDEILRIVLGGEEILSRVLSVRRVR